MALSPLYRALAELVRIPSVSGDEGAIADYVCVRLKDAGAVFERDADNNVIAFLGPDGDDPLCLCGHLDTVPAGKGWDHDPLEPRLADGVMTGLGVSDMKSGLALMLDAVTWDLEVPVVLAFITNEEEGTHEGSDGVTPFLARYRPRAAVVLEPTVVDGRLLVEAGCQGDLVARYVFEGRAAHSSRPELGDNAITKAARLMADVEHRANGLRPIPLHSGMTVDPSLAVTIVDAGIRSNIIPDRATVTVNRRVAPVENMDAVMEDLAALGPAEFPMVCPGYILPEGDAFLEEMLDVCRRTLGYAQPYCARGWGDAAEFTAAGIPAVSLGPGILRACHEPNEPCVLADLDRCKAVLQRLLGGTAR
ncbi:MAG: M20/M25/M40 family metallo-hydrolase [Candidatus Undinarchaeales archaeon]|jgi:succinyl-diaminopimelate desuccinylase|nr:M20/M25/M40 family metallo-hydrolase [Candidatus Undinarchaeales archaeon]MDP7494426.1 M20/M25/M40 family metallo-hydrolase [Candidatus Undinarchaeales archaeon]